MSNKRMVRVYAKQPVNYFQDGGMQQMQQMQAPPQQQMDPQQIMQIIQMFAEATGNDPQQVMMQFQQLQPNEQMQALDQMVQTIQTQQTQQNDQVAAATMPQAPTPGSGMSVSEEMAQMEGAPGEGEMAEQMMRMGGMYAKSQKKLLKKAIGGAIAKNGDTAKSIQKKLGEVVKAAIGLNFTENLIDNSANNFNSRNQNTFSAGGTSPDNSFYTSANETAKDSFKKQMESNWLFNQRVDNALDEANYNPYLRVKGKAIGDEYNIFNRPRFKQNIFTTDGKVPTIEEMGYGALFPENIPSQQRYGGQPMLNRFQIAGQVEMEKSQKDQVLKLNEAHAKGLVSDEEYMATMNKLDEAYENLVDPKGTAVYNDNKETTTDDKTVEGTGYDYNLRWKGNLDKATENLYLKGADAKYGIWGSNGFLGMRPGKGNIRKMTLTFGERGTGAGMATPESNIAEGYNPKAVGPGYSGYNADTDGNGLPDYLQTPNPQLNQNTTTTGSSSSSGPFTETMTARERRQQRRYARMFGDDAAEEAFGAPVTSEESDLETETGTGTSMTDQTSGAGVQRQPLVADPATYKQPNPNGGYIYKVGNVQYQSSDDLSPEQVVERLQSYGYRDGGVANYYPYAYRFGGRSNFGYGLPLAIDGIDSLQNEEDKFKITMKEKSGAASQWAPVIMAGAQNFADSINTSRALNQRNLAYNAALNNAVVPGDMLGSLGSFTDTTGQSVMMPNLTQGMLQGRFAAAAPEQMTGMYYTQYGGQPNIAGLNIGDDAYMTDQEIETFMRMGGKVQYY